MMFSERRTEEETNMGRNRARNRGRTKKSRLSHTADSSRTMEAQNK